MEAEQRRERLALARQAGPQPVAKEPTKRDVDKVGRNEACSCGSGKKYKRCCGQ
jgi:preprotein translocase subunit SecA